MRPVMQKNPRYENRKLLDLCHGAPCHLNYPGCTGGTSPDASSVPCHSNTHADGRGSYYKTHDHSAVPGCPSCHHQHDHGSLYTHEQKVETHERAQKRWRDYLWRNRLIKVA